MGLMDSLPASNSSKVTQLASAKRRSQDENNSRRKGFGAKGSCKGAWATIIARTPCGCADRQLKLRIPLHSLCSTGPISGAYMHELQRGFIARLRVAAW
jgi:hypothetical protein